MGERAGEGVRLSAGVVGGAAYGTGLVGMHRGFAAVTGTDGNMGRK